MYDKGKQVFGKSHGFPFVTCRLLIVDVKVFTPFAFFYQAIKTKYLEKSIIFIVSYFSHFDHLSGKNKGVKRNCLKKAITVTKHSISLFYSILAFFSNSFIMVMGTIS